MSKNSNDQQDKKVGRGTRRHTEGKVGLSQFQWDSVDDQSQEDMIEPTPVSTTKQSRSRQQHRRDKDVGTMYVASSSSQFGANKKKRPEAPRAEDYAEFVAELDEGEEDPFATPSYGRTKLTHNDEVFVEELSVPREKKEKRAKERVKYEDKGNDAEERDSREKKEKRSKERVKSAMVVDDVRDEASEKKGRQVSERNVEEQKNRAQEEVSSPRKRSFLAKIKEAIATGAISSDREDSQAVSEKKDDQVLSQKRLNRLTQNVKKALNAAGSDVDLSSLENNGANSQLEKIVNLLEALVESNLALVERAVELEQKNASEVKRETPVKERNGEDKRKKVLKAEEIFNEPESRERTEEEKSDGSKKRKDKKRDGKSDDDNFQSRRSTSQKELLKEEDYDPIAAWENIEDDEEDFDNSSTFPEGRERGARKDEEIEEEFDDWADVESKKKSARIRKDAQNESLLEKTSSVVPKGEDASSAKEFGVSADGKNKRESVKRAKRERVVQYEEEETRPLEKFGDLNLSTATLKALRQMGYVDPTPIQTGTIPRIQAGVDLMGQAQTGTGKTAAFMIPIIEGVDALEPSRNPLALAVVPTRELAVQVRDEAQRIAQFRDMNIVACYGGKPIASQVEKIRRGVDILVGTPGRIIDLINRGALSLREVHWVVLDEADRMLDIGFRPDVEKILRQTPSSRQTLLFSATLAPPVVRLAKAYMKEPEQLDFSQKDVSADTIEQFYITVDKDRKFDALVRLLETQQPRQAIVFCRTKRCVDGLERRLSSLFKDVEAIHGDLPQSRRDHIMSDFRAEKTKILVATDIVGRGIDVSSVSHIVNYDIPQFCDDYVHRVGRAGRMGREGVAFTLVTVEEGSELTRIEIRIDRLLKRMDLPGFEAYSRPVDDPDAEPEADRFERKPVFGQTRRRFSRAL